MTDKEQYIDDQIATKLQFWIKIFIVLAIILFLLLGVMDYFATPENFHRFIKYRIAISVILAALFYLNTLKRDKLYQYIIITNIIVLSGVTVELMIMQYGGHASSYYSGLNLIIVGAFGLIPFNLPLSISVAFVIYAIYVVPILIFDHIANIPKFVENNAFMIATFCIALTWRILTQKSMINELSLQYDLAQERNKLEQTVQERTKEWHQSEKWHRSLFENATDGIVVLDKNGIIINVNEKACALYGFPREALIGTHSRVLESTDSQEIIAERLARVLGGDPLVFKIEHSRNGGSRIALEVSSKATTIGDAVYVQSFHRDITEREKMEAEFLTVKMQRIESLGVLAGGIAHDFNNILTSILTNIYLAKMAIDSNSDAYHRLLESEKASERARNLTQQLLTFSRGGAPVKQTLSLCRIIKDSTLFALGGSNVGCEFLLHDDLLPVEADERQMEQVIHNLIINAAQAMPDGGVVGVCAENVLLGPEDGIPAATGKYIKITVRDHGVGIRAEHLSRIYDPYFTTKPKGKGLGLSVVFSIIKNHGGQINVESTPGTSTTFQIYLPASDKEAPMKSEEVSQPISCSGNILIMDDEEPIRTAVSEILSRLGYTVEVSKDGGEAYEKYRRAMESGKPFDAVIIDLTVPGGMGGKELIGKLRDIDPGVRGIVSSGYSTDPIMADFRAHGFCGVVTKPYNIQTLSKTLHDALTKTVS